MDSFQPLYIHHFLITDVSGKKFAFDINEIDSIHSSKSKGAFDDMEDLKAAVRLHKKVIPIISLRRKFVLNSQSMPMFPSLLFLKSKRGGRVITIGVQVDMTLEVVEVSQYHFHKKKYGHSKIQGISRETVETIPVLTIGDLITEEELIYFSTEVLN